MKRSRMNERFLSQLAINLLPLVEEIIEIINDNKLSQKTKVLSLRIALINAETDVKQTLASCAKNLFGSESDMEFRAGRTEECHLPQKSNIVVTYFLN